jgi:hypothetical protein
MDLLTCLKEIYPGPVICIFVQFPTPYRFKKPDDLTPGGYNSQLPTVDGFFVSSALIEAAGDLLSCAEGGGILMMQTNAEDVAVLMMETVERTARVRRLEHTENDALASHSQTVFPRRQQRFRSQASTRVMGALPKFDVGDKWRPSKDWPLGGFDGSRRCRSETEATYELDLKPVYRSLYRF